MASKIHERQDVSIQTSSDELALTFHRDRYGAHLLGHRVSKGKIYHEALLAPELTRAGLIRIIQDVVIGGSCVKAAESDGVRRQEAFGLPDGEHRRRH